MNKNEEYPWDELFEIARKAIITYLEKREYLKIENDSPKKATFVTLEINGMLRGCIGSIFPMRSLKQDVAINAVNAAFFDPRFVPISKEELKYLDITISILSDLKEFNGSNEEWLDFLRENKPGVYISSNRASATFLPEVWKEIKDADLFMKYLSLKAGVGENEWKNMKKYYYFVDAQKRKFYE